MKCFAAIVLFALFVVAYAAGQPVEPAPGEAEHIQAKAQIAPPTMLRDKRGVLYSYPYFSTPYAFGYGYYDSYLI